MKLIFFLFAFYCFLLNACNTIYKADPRKSAATRLIVTPPDTLIQKQRTGIDFFAEGNDPLPWTLELDLEKGFAFQPSGSRLLIAAPVQADRLTNAGADTYITNTDSGMMKVIVYSEKCIGNGQVKTASLKTEVTISNKRYSGCGKYLYDYRLNDIWSLQYIDNTEPGSTDYKKQLPWIEFNLEKNKMYGYDGCNNISSDIKIEGNRIKFSPFTGTKTACQNNEMTKIFSTMISGQIIDYYIKDERLVLTLMNESKLIFTKQS